MIEIDAVIDQFVTDNELELSLSLLKTIALPEQGGLGYRLVFFDPRLEIDGYDVEHGRKVIRLDTRGLFGSEKTVTDVADSLKSAMQVEILRTHTGLLSRVGWGTGKVVLGVVESGVGLVGILIPEPGTTIAGIAVFALGANTVVDGFSQLAGANRGEGYNILGQASGALGSGLATAAGGDPRLGRVLGEGAFAVTSIAVGSFGSIRLLRIRGQAFVRIGVGGRPGGATLGRLDMLYPSSRAGDGMTIINVNNNAGQSILRFVTHGGRLMVNGRIVNSQKVLRHEADPRAVLRGLLKLLAHGARQGW